MKKKNKNKKNSLSMEVDEIKSNDLPNNPFEQPVKRKNVKPEILRKLLKQVFESVFNPNAIGALYALFEKDSFLVAVTDLKQEFKATLYIDGMVFESFASQKKKARNEVATKALKHFFWNELYNMSEKCVENGFSVTAGSTECSSDRRNDIEILEISRNATLNAVAKCAKLHSNDTNNGNAQKKVKRDGATCMDPLLLPPMRKEIKSNILERVVKQALGIEECQNPNTVTALYTLFERDSFHFEVIPVDNNDNKFSARLHINGRIYSESSSSIKKAKTKATIKALKELFPRIANESDGSAVSDCSEQDEYFQLPIKESSDSEMHTHPTNTVFNTMQSSLAERSDKSSRCYSFCDYIASLVQNKYNAVIQSYPEHLQRYSVLSGIVMIQNSDMSNATVICVCTGNKCLRGDYVSKDGNVLFDCHAEILSRRCLMLFLYSQLNLSLSSSNETILELLDDGRYKVKNGVKFYLYVSSAPCGDGRVFSFSAAKNPDRPKLMGKRGQLRVKLESGMGGIPVTEYAGINPTFEDYMQGQQMVLMCCSAKLLRSNVLGAQGALLSYFLQPVYFDGILTGDIFHRANLERALYKRVENEVLKSLPSTYKLNTPSIDGITNSKIVINVKPGKSCMNWIVCEPTVEFIKTKTGQTSQDSVSRLSKMNLFKQFLNIYVVIFKNIEATKAASTSYFTYKQMATSYQFAKNLFFEALESNCRGQWLRKSKESDSFLLENFYNSC